MSRNGFAAGHAGSVSVPAHLGAGAGATATAGVGGFGASFRDAVPSMTHAASFMTSRRQQEFKDRGVRDRDHAMRIWRRGRKIRRELDLYRLDSRSRSRSRSPSLSPHSSRSRSHSRSRSRSPHRRRHIIGTEKKEGKEKKENPDVPATATVQTSASYPFVDLLLFSTIFVLVFYFVFHVGLQQDKVALQKQLDESASNLADAWTTGIMFGLGFIFTFFLAKVSHTQNMKMRKHILAMLDRVSQPKLQSTPSTTVCPAVACSPLFAAPTTCSSPSPAATTAEKGDSKDANSSNASISVAYSQAEIEEIKELVKPIWADWWLNLN